MVVKWERVSPLGSGSSATVTLGLFKDECCYPRLMAVKSAPSSKISMLEQEKAILDLLQPCSEIIDCFGEDRTVGADGEEIYNIFLQYTPCGSLFDRLKSSDHPLSELEVRRYTNSILRGLAHIHRKGYVHCDVKPQNILIWSSDEVKIADFGLAKRSGEKSKGFCIRGTPLYVAPECVARNEYEPPSDVWSLGCTVIEMVTGEPARKFPTGMEWPAVLFRIGQGAASPEIPKGLSEEGKEFLSRCLAKEPEKRWTAEALLKHPFVSKGKVVKEGGSSAVAAQCAPKRSRLVSGDGKAAGGLVI